MNASEITDYNLVDISKLQNKWLHNLFKFLTTLANAQLGLFVIVIVIFVYIIYNFGL